MSTQRFARSPRLSAWAAAAAGRERLPAIDFLKAGAIVTVVWIHSLGGPLDFRSLPLAAYLTSWAVPAFFFTSGFLHHRTAPVPPAELKRWLLRLLIPYAVASLAALAFRRVARGSPLGADDAIFALLTGSAWGIYYFVPVLAGAYLAATLLARLPGAAPLLLAIFGLWGLLSVMGLDPVERGLGVFWLLRSPSLWWGYFFAGWMTARHAERLEALGAGRALAAALLLALVVAIAQTCTGSGVCTPLAGPSIYLTNYCIIASVLLLGWDAPRIRPIELLSDATYPIYLYHFFFTSEVRQHGERLMPHAGAAAFVAGCVGSLAVLLAARALLGRRARVVIG